MKSVVTIVHKRTDRRSRAAVLCVALCLAGGQLFAQSIPLHIGTSYPIQDEFGRPLEGTATAPTTVCDRVEILQAGPGGTIQPPDVDGNAAPSNPMLTNGLTRIGALAAIGDANPAVFGAALVSPRPAVGTSLFVRVFNAPTKAAASFYADSAVVVVHAEASAIYDVQVRSMTPIDPRDEDGDGLNNAWEKSMGSDRLNPDTDGDGMRDGDEFRAGTGLLDEDSLLIMADVTPWGSNGLKIEWDSVPGKMYSLQYSTNNLPEDDSFVDYDGVVTGETGTTVSQKIVPNGRRLDRLHIRVRLVE